VAAKPNKQDPTKPNK
jgi:hypothetical protein